MRLVRFGWVPLVLLVLASPVLAEKGMDYGKHAGQSPEEMAKNAVNKWKQTLKLTDAQVPQFEAVMTDSYKKMADAKTAAAGDKAKMKTSMATIMKDREEALSKVLTPDQLKTYQQKMTKMNKQAKAHMAKAEEAESKETTKGDSK